MDKIIENHRAYQSNGITREQLTFKSFQDGSQFKERILLVLYVDDFESFGYFLQKTQPLWNLLDSVICLRDDLGCFFFFFFFAWLKAHFK